MNDRLHYQQVLNGSPNHVLSLEEASKYLGVSKAAIRKWKRNGVGPSFFRCGKLLRFRKQDLDEWIAVRLETPSGK